MTRPFVTTSQAAQRVYRFLLRPPLLFTRGAIATATAAAVSHTEYPYLADIRLWLALPTEKLEMATLLGTAVTLHSLLFLQLASEIPVAFQGRSSQIPSCRST